MLRNAHFIGATAVVALLVTIFQIGDRKCSGTCDAHVEQAHGEHGHGEAAEAHEAHEEEASHEDHGAH